MYPPRVHYTGNGSQREFDCPFPYLDGDHVKVTVDGFPMPFTWINASRLRLPAPPVTGSAVEVFRQTPADPLREIKANQPIPAILYNLLTRQALMLAEEGVTLSKELRTTMDGLLDGALADKYEQTAPDFAAIYAQHSGTPLTPCEHDPDSDWSPSLVDIYKDTLV